MVSITALKTIGKPDLDNAATSLEEAEASSLPEQSVPFIIDGDGKDVQEKQALLYFYESVSLFSALLSVVVLVLKSSLSTLSVGAFNGGVPALILYLVAVIITLALARVFLRPLSSQKGIGLIFIVSFFGSIVGPFGLLFDAIWPIALIVTAVGDTALMFLCWSHLSLLGHKLLSVLVAAVFTLAALIMILFGVLNFNSLVAMVIVGCLALFANILVYSIRDARVFQLVKTDALKSRKHFRDIHHTHIGQLNYFLTGLLLGVCVGLVYLFQLFGSPVDHSSIIILLSIPSLIAGVVMLALRNLAEYVFERVIKDYFAFLVALALLPVPFISSSVQVVCLVLLLTITMTQIVIVATAIIEIIRFENISPLWYVGEFAYLFGGMAAGILFSWLCTSNPLNQQGLMICCFVTILFTSFSQVVINNVSYPRQSMFNEIGLSAGSAGGNENNAERDDGATKGGAHWKRKVEFLTEQYELSNRQSEILELLAKGRDVAYIMEKFYISKSTAKTHVYNIYRKMGIHSRQDLLNLIDNTVLSDDKHQG